MGYIDPITKKISSKLTGSPYFSDFKVDSSSDEVSYLLKYYKNEEQTKKSM